MTTNPTNQLVCAGGTATFTAAATSNASDHTVQWQVKVPAGSFTDIPGATSTTLSFTATAGQNGNEYQAVFTTACGSATTSFATLTVDTLPVVTTNPLTQTVCAGGTATFTAAATSNASDHTVQWQVKVPAGSFTDIPGATSTTLSFTTTAGQNGNQYQAVFTDACGSATTTIATLTVDTLPVVTTNPLTQTVCAGGTATFTAAATSNASDHTVQWQVKVPAGSFTDIPGATSTTLSFTTTAGQNGNQYQAVFTAACGSSTTSVATLTVDTLPAVTTNPLTQTVCAGATVNLTAAATSNASDHTVQWQVKVPAGSFTDIGGATSTTLSFTATAGQNGNQYRAVFTDACGSANTTAATLTVDTLPVVTTNPANRPFAPARTASFTVTATSNASDHTVQWQVDDGLGGGFVNIGGATSTTLSFTANVGQNGYKYRAVFTNACGSTNTNFATLTVNTAPAVTLDPSNTTVCADHHCQLHRLGLRFAVADRAVAGRRRSRRRLRQHRRRHQHHLLVHRRGEPDRLQVPRRLHQRLQHRHHELRHAHRQHAPAVTTQSDHAAVQSPEQPSSFTAAASGTPSPTVQWQVDAGGRLHRHFGRDQHDVHPHRGALGERLQYRAVFTNSCGTATTNAATLTVTCPAITVAAIRRRLPGRHVQHRLHR